MYTTLISKIDTTLDKVDKISKIYNYPETKLKGFPAVLFRPDTFENSFESVKENFKIYRFSMWVVVSSDETKTMEDVFGTILPDVVDDIVAQFDEDWDGGTIDGHRCWIKIDSGIWGVDETQDSVAGFAELDLVIKVLTSN